MFNKFPLAPIVFCKCLRSAVNSREHFSVLYENFGFKNSGLTLEFRSLVDIGRSGVIIGRLRLNMGS